MEMKMQLRGILCLLFAIHSAAGIEWNFEFGQKGIGANFYEHDGKIGPFGYRNFYTIPTPSPATRITYTKVTVWAINPPKVDLDANKNVVSIIYTFGEVPISSFKIQAEGVKSY